MTGNVTGTQATLPAAGAPYTPPAGRLRKGGPPPRKEIEPGPKAPPRAGAPPSPPPAGPQLKTTRGRGGGARGGLSKHPLRYYGGTGLTPPVRRQASSAHRRYNAAD